MVRLYGLCYMYFIQRQLKFFSYSRHRELSFYADPWGSHQTAENMFTSDYLVISLWFYKVSLNLFFSIWSVLQYEHLYIEVLFTNDDFVK